MGVINNGADIRCGNLSGILDGWVMCSHNLQNSWNERFEGIPQA